MNHRKAIALGALTICFIAWISIVLKDESISETQVRLRCERLLNAQVVSPESTLFDEWEVTQRDHDSISALGYFRTRNHAGQLEIVTYECHGWQNGDDVRAEIRITP